jgi:hypothetical protein
MSDEEYDWKQKVEELKEAGYPVFAPNNLPIRCITADGTMKEHEHSDHIDYKFPVMCEYVGGNKEDYYSTNGLDEKFPMDEWEIDEQNHEEHALIYTDGFLAVTMFEYCYSIWYLREDGHCGGGFDQKWDRKNNKGWKLDAESIKKIKEYYENFNK